MRIFKYTTAILFLLATVYSCKQEELGYYAAQNSILFEGFDNKADNIYTPTDSSNFSFGYVSAYIRDSLAFISVLATGGPQNVDRPYKLNISNKSTLKPGVDYELLNKDFVIKANQVRDTLILKLIRTDVMKTTPLFLDLKLEANENFNTAITDQIIGSGINAKLKNFTRLHLSVDDIAGPPWFWDPAKNPYSSTFIGYLGTFSTKKFQLMIGRFDLDINVITTEKYLPPATSTLAWGKSLQSYLNQMESEGTPILEEDGSLMKMGQYAQ